MKKATFITTVTHLLSPISSALSKESNSHITTLYLNVQETIQINPLNFLNFKNYHYFLHILIISFVFLLIQPLFAEQIKNCPQCDSNYSGKYSYCPMDGDVLISKSIDAKEIEGFQNYKWDISVDEARKLGKGLVFEVDNSKPNIIVLNSNNFEFEEKQSLLKLEFYNDKLYKASVHFVSEANQASVNDYFSRAELLKDIYGITRKIVFGWESDEESGKQSLIKLEFYNDKLYKASVQFVTEASLASVYDYSSRAELFKDIYGSTRRIAIGWGSDEEDSRLTSMNIKELTYQHKSFMNIKELTYQHKWKTVLGDLNYQIGSGGYGNFIHSFFYSSKDAGQIDNEKLRSEF